MTANDKSLTPVFHPPAAQSKAERTPLGLPFNPASSRKLAESILNGKNPPPRSLARHLTAALDEVERMTARLAYLEANACPTQEEYEATAGPLYASTRDEYEESAGRG